MVHGESKSSSSCPPTARTELGGVRVCCVHKRAMWECMYVYMYICRYMHHSDSLCVHVCVCVCMHACSSIAAAQLGLVSSLLLEV